ncbi:MAG: 50S ribosomal protein L11 methyltransferase [Flavipsychrobacter sp.]|nr:50S ribosomal protein L11 methyltransferase [Flavipsychrobacter sp.]
MHYQQVTISVEAQEQKDILIALLEHIGYEGFEEQPTGLVAFIPEEEYSEASLAEVLTPFGVEFSLQRVEQQNWNAQWESNFSPVIVEGFCTVRAGFHDMEVTTPYEIVITPKMSFGTGHHATTRLMMQRMGAMEFAGKKVLDFGTGTGILAILAHMLGATDIEAIDNDEWSYENSVENVTGNNAAEIKVKLGSLDAAEGTYDIILANINRHILLHYMSDLYDKLNPTGTVLMSGILTEDLDIIENAAEQAGFILAAREESNNWLCLLFNKKTV